MSQEQGLIRADERADAPARNAERREMEARALVTRSAPADEGMATQLRQALEGERERVAALAGELAAARREIERRGALMTTVSSEISDIRRAGEATALYLQQVLEEQRERVASLTQELAAARRELETQTARATAAAEAAAMASQEALERESQRADVPAAEPPRPAAHETEVTAASANPTSVRTSHLEMDAAPAQPAKDASVIDGPAPADAEAGVEARKLLVRADLLRRQGDISAARVVLERAVEVGSAEANYRLAETYDPLVLSSWGTLGTRGDPGKARELYARAYADGIQQAKDRINALQ